MSMKVRPDYINPLTVMDKKSAQGFARPSARQRDSAAELQTKRQQLQNQMLLLKAAGTDSAGATAETQKALEAELEQISTELRAAQADPTQPAEQAGAAARPRQDWYEPEEAQPAAPGIYQVEGDGEQGYRISFLPYSE